MKDPQGVASLYISQRTTKQNILRRSSESRSYRTQKGRCLRTGSFRQATQLLQRIQKWSYVFRFLPSKFPTTIADSVRPISLEDRVTPKRLVARLGRKGVCRTRRWQANGPLEGEGQPRPHFFSALYKNKRDEENVRRQWQYVYLTS